MDLRIIFEIAKPDKIEKAFFETDGSVTGKRKRVMKPSQEKIYRSNDAQESNTVPVFLFAF